MPKDRSLWLFAVALVMALLSSGIQFWTAWQSSQNFEAVVALQSRLNHVSGAIGRLDEALTMSARMAAATGDPQWERRYLSLETQLDSAIAEARQLVRNRDCPDQGLRVPALTLFSVRLPGGVR